MFTRRLMAILLSALATQAGASPLALVEGAKAQVGVTVRYDPAYRALAYPGGDVAPDRGVCTDVVVRAYRKIGIDLQQLVHEDMRAAWTAYPRHANWKLRRPDPNIDHRRVPNLMTFFRRHGLSLSPSRDPAAYRPGDIVTWRLEGGLTHIGVVSDRSSAGGVPLIVHNIGSGAKVEDMLFAFPVTGHYRYPKQPNG